MPRDVRQRKIDALRAEIRQVRNESITEQEKIDIEWLNAKRREELLTESLLRISKSDYCKLASRSKHAVESHAAKHQLPIGNATIDLYQVVKAFHDLIDRKGKLLEAADEDAKYEREKAKFEIKQIRQKSELLDLEVAAKKRELVSREQVREKLTWISRKLRFLGERLGKSYGIDVQIAMNEYLEEMATEMESGNLKIE